MLSATRVAEGLQQSDATAIVDTQATEMQTPGTSNAPLATSGMIADSSEGSTNKKIVTPATPIAAKVAPLATENNGPAGVLPVAVASGADATTTSGDQNVPNPSTSLALDLAGSRSTPSVTAEPVGPRDAIDVSNAVDPVTTAAGGALLENRGPHVVSPPPTGPASESPEKLVQGDQKCTDAFTTGGPLLRVGAGNSGELEADKSRQQTATGMIATPWCLAPANIHARARAGQPAAMYEERRRLAARIALISSSPSEPLCGDAAASKGGGSGGENLNKRTLVDESEEVDTATGRAAGHTSGAFKTASPTRHNVSSGAVRVSGLSSHATSPESRGVVHGGRDEGESPHNAGAWSFGIGGSASCFGQVDKGKEDACGPGVQIGGSHASGLHHGEEKILEVQSKK